MYIQVLKVDLKDIKFTDQLPSKTILVSGALVYTFYHLLWSKTEIKKCFL